MADVWAHRAVFLMLARKDFQTRYKRAAFGVLWAVAVPVLQGVVMAAVFSQIIPRSSTGINFGAYVFGGVLAFSYFGTTLTAGVTAIVDGSSLTDKVWFPRVLLVLVPAVANLVSLGVSMVVLLFVLPVLGVDLSTRLLLLGPAMVLLVLFSMALTLVVSALQVYYRDTRFLVQAAMLVWIYLTPVLYTRDLLGRFADWVDLNPLTGIVALIHRATVGGSEALLRPVTISVAMTVMLTLIGFEAQRRHDRLFVDLL